MNKPVLTSGIITLGIPLIYSLTKPDLLYICIYILIWCSSINYWRNPVIGIRRNIDITFVSSGFLYQNYLILQNGYQSSIYYTCMLIGLFYYYLSNKFKFEPDYLHCGFHFFCNLASLSLIIQFYFKFFKSIPTRRYMTLFH